LTTLGIDFGCTNGSGNPANKVFEDTLVELVKNIRHNGAKDMGVRKVDPEGFDDRFGGSQQDQCQRNPMP